MTIVEADPFAQALGRQSVGGVQLALITAEFRPGRRTSTGVRAFALSPAPKGRTPARVRGTAGGGSLRSRRPAAGLARNRLAGDRGGRRGLVGGQPRWSSSYQRADYRPVTVGPDLRGRGRGRRNRRAAARLKPRVAGSLLAAMAAGRRHRRRTRRNAGLRAARAGRLRFSPGGGGGVTGFRRARGPSPARRGRSVESPSVAGRARHRTRSRRCRWC